jgi:hypothetical protein
VVIIALVVAAGLAVAWRLYQQYGTGDEVTVQGISNVTDHQITIRFLVHEPDRAGATCRLQAQDYSHAEVGYAEIQVAAGSDVTVSYTLSTSSRAYSADVLGCTPIRAP